MLHRRIPSIGATIVVILALSACGDSARSPAVDVLSESDDGSPSAFSTAERLVLDERLRQLEFELLMETGSSDGNVFGYTPVDGTVDGFVVAGQDPVERCQAVADAIGELSGPLSTVPIRVLRDRSGDGTAGYDIVATGAGSGRCGAG